MNLHILTKFTLFEIFINLYNNTTKCAISVELYGKIWNETYFLFQFKHSV